MPGVVGTISLDGEPLDLNLIAAMRKSVTHQQWYRIDEYRSETNALAISVVDLDTFKRQKQPYLERADGVKVFLHGEINNDECAGEDPLRFIYSQYKRSGPNFAAKLNGSFIAIVVDEEKHTVLIANDRLASKPIFYFNDGKVLYFGPEIKSILVVPSLKRTVNLTAVADFLSRGHFTRDHTFIEDLHQMNNATVLKITPAGLFEHRYWQWNLEQGEDDHGAAYFRRELIKRLRKAVYRCSRAENAYGLLVSGGYDSGGILGAFLTEFSQRPLHTISWGRADDIPGSDAAVGRKLGKKFGSDHRFYKLSAEEVAQKFHDFVFFGEGLTWYPESYDLFHRIKDEQNVQILLRGDQCFGYGYTKWLEAHDELSMLRSLGINPFSTISNYRKVLKPSYYEEFCRRDAETIDHISARCTEKNILSRQMFFYFDVRIRYFLNPLNYVKTFAVESVRPLLDYDIIDFVGALPVKYKAGKNLWRHAVTEAFPEIFQETAVSRTDLDWGQSFRASGALKGFLYENLMAGGKLFDDFIDKAQLKIELDEFFAQPGTVTRKTSLRAAALKMVRRCPTTYAQLHKWSHYFNKWRGNTSVRLPSESVLLRLLILKFWGDIFLEYPVGGCSHFPTQVREDGP
jgi:asparagine synthetase B (glutamine-hydrolysing)